MWDLCGAAFKDLKQDRSLRINLSHLRCQQLPSQAQPISWCLWAGAASKSASKLHAMCVEIWRTIILHSYMQIWIQIKKWRCLAGHMLAYWMRVPEQWLKFSHASASWTRYDQTVKLSTYMSRYSLDAPGTIHSWFDIQFRTTSDLPQACAACLRWLIYTIGDSALGRGRRAMHWWSSVHGVQLSWAALCCGYVSVLDVRYEHIDARCFQHASASEIIAGGHAKLGNCTHTLLLSWTPKSSPSNGL